MKKLESATTAAARSASATTARSATATTALSAAWSASSADANAPKSWGKLWRDKPPPKRLEQAWQALKKQWNEDGPHWSFWITWYEAILEGSWTNWDLIYRIAMEISDEEWGAGQARVAERIAEIESEFLLACLPQVNEIYVTEDGLYEVRGTTSQTSKLTDSILNRISFTLETAVQSNMCDLNEMSLPSKILRQALAVGDADANTLEQYLRRASTLIKAGIESGKYSDDDEINFLTATLDELALQLRADHPDVAEATAKRLQARLREIDDRSRIRTAELIENLREGTAQRLSAELQLAAEVTLDGSSVEATADAVKESGNTASKISALERLKHAEGSGQMAATKMFIRARDLVTDVLSLISGGGA